jgi:hypothetical protein
MNARTADQLAEAAETAESLRIALRQHEAKLPQVLAASEEGRQWAARRDRLIDEINTLEKDSR